MEGLQDTLGQMNGRMEQLEKTFEKVCDYVEKINARLTRLEERNGTNKTTAAYNALFAELGSRLQQAATAQEVSTDIPEQKNEPKENNEKTGKSRKRKRADPDRPKRPPTSYLLFCADKRAKLTGEEREEMRKKPRDFLAQCGQAWKNASEEVKNQFKAQAQPGMDQYKRDFAVYNQQKRSKKTTGSASDEAAAADATPKETTDPVKAKKKQKSSKKPAPAADKGEAAAAAASDDAPTQPFYAGSEPEVEKKPDAKPAKKKKKKKSKKKKNKKKKTAASAKK